MAAADPLESASDPGGGQSPGILRKAVPGEKKALKEKIIAYYESILKVSSRTDVSLDSNAK